MEKNIKFTDWHEKSPCLIVDGMDLYVLGRWEEDKWVDCLKIENEVVKKLVKIKPIIKGDKIEGVEIYD